MIAIDLSKQQELDASPKAIQRINFTRNLSGNNNKLIFFIVEEVNKTELDFSQGTIKVLQFYFILTLNQYKLTQYNNLNVKLFNS